MAFHVLSGPSGPVTIAGQQISQVFDLVRQPDEKQIFVRLVALFHDGDPLGGRAPTLHIKAGPGSVFAPVDANSSVDAIASPVGVENADGKVVGTATSERLKNDIFLLTISDIAKNSGPWRLRIQNNDAESLRFLGFTAPNSDDTLQPWLVLGGPDDPDHTVSFFNLINQGPRLRDIEVRNLGTKPLLFFDTPGPVGGSKSVRIKLIPVAVPPHGLETLRFECDENAFAEIVLSLRCDDTIAAHSRLELSVHAPVTLPSHQPVVPSGPRGNGILM